MWDWTGEQRENTGAHGFLESRNRLQMSDALGGSLYIQIPSTKNVHASSDGEFNCFRPIVF